MLVTESIRRTRETMLYRRIFVNLWDVDVSRGLVNMIRGQCVGFQLSKQK